MVKTECRFPELINNCKPVYGSDGKLMQGNDLQILYGAKAFGHGKMACILNYKDGLLNSEPGMPAVQFDDFHTEYWTMGKLNREEYDEEGNLLPAIISDSGNHQEGWINGKRQY